MIRPSLVAITVAVGLELAGAAKEQLTFRAMTNAVAVDVSVRDGGRPVQGLTQLSFELRDKGARQQIVDLSIEALPLDIVLLLDSSASMEAGALGRLRGVSKELAAVVRADDRLDIIGFAGQVFKAGTDGTERNWSAPDGSLTALYDSVLVVSLRAPDPHRRRLVIVVSDGLDTTSGVGHSARWAVLDRSDIVINVLRIADSYWSQQVSMGRRLYSFSWPLEELADRTGGVYYDLKSTDDFTPVLRQCVEQFRQRYLLRYIPTDASVGWHEVTVTVPKKKYEIRHRRGYYRSTER